jgi:hypothetical protein
MANNFKAPKLDLDFRRDSDREIQVYDERGFRTVTLSGKAVSRVKHQLAELLLLDETTIVEFMKGVDEQEWPNVRLAAQLWDVTGSIAYFVEKLTQLAHDMQTVYKGTTMQDRTVLDAFQFEYAILQRLLTEEDLVKPSKLGIRRLAQKGMATAGVGSDNVGSDNEQIVRVLVPANDENMPKYEDLVASGLTNILDALWALVHLYYQIWKGMCAIGVTPEPIEITIGTDGFDSNSIILLLELAAKIAEFNKEGMNIRLTLIGIRTDAEQALAVAKALSKIRATAPGINWNTVITGIRLILDGFQHYAPEQHLTVLTERYKVVTNVMAIINMTDTADDKRVEALSVTGITVEGKEMAAVLAELEALVSVPTGLLAEMVKVLGGVCVCTFAWAGANLKKFMALARLSAQRPADYDAARRAAAALAGAED